MHIDDLPENDVSQVKTALSELYRRQPENPQGAYSVQKTCGTISRHQVEIVLDALVADGQLIVKRTAVPMRTYHFPMQTMLRPQPDVISGLSRLADVWAGAIAAGVATEPDIEAARQWIGRLTSEESGVADA